MEDGFDNVIAMLYQRVWSGTGRRNSNLLGNGDLAAGQEPDSKPQALCGAYIPAYLCTAPDD